VLAVAVASRKSAIADTQAKPIITHRNRREASRFVIV
jgi:hypothetical protein